MSTSIFFISKLSATSRAGINPPLDIVAIVSNSKPDFFILSKEFLPENQCQTMSEKIFPFQLFFETNFISFILLSINDFVHGFSKLDRTK